MPAAHRIGQAWPLETMPLLLVANTGGKKWEDFLRIGVAGSLVKPCLLGRRLASGV